ncbi:MAG: dihydrodipicolinate synthase family protein [Halieaceae bacterium]|jgi:4-hydroxy-tetrahydrodipicolinate synthase|nr:dihydrodipicolinate synthase family protein [Halieaceae bacterium]
MHDFVGTYTVMVTPFTPDGSGIEEGVLRDFVDWQIEQGIGGLIPLGSTGEVLSLSDEERHRVAKVSIEQARGRVPVLIGVAAENPLQVLRYARDAQELGAQGLLAIPPFYSTPTDDEVYAHYRCIGEGVSIPIMVYNNPAITNIDLSPALIARLADIPNVAYVKESTLEVTRVRDLVAMAGDRLGVFGGVLGFESFLDGACGWTAVGANVLPNEFQAMYRHCVAERDIDSAQRLYRRLLPLIDLVGGPRYVSATKSLLARLGWPVGPPRLPRLPSPDAELAWVDRVIQQMQLTGRS